MVSEVMSSSPLLRAGHLGHDDHELSSWSSWPRCPARSKGDDDMTSDTIAAPRTPAPSRRRGSNLEKWGWIYMRASGVLLVVLIFGHLFINLVAGDGVRQIDFAFVA